MLKLVFTNNCRFAIISLILTLHLAHSYTSARTCRCVCIGIRELHDRLRHKDYCSPTKMHTADPGHCTHHNCGDIHKQYVVRKDEYTKHAHQNRYWQSQMKCIQILRVVASCATVDIQTITKLWIKLQTSKPKWNRSPPWKIITRL